MSTGFYIGGVLIENMYGAKGPSTAPETGIKVAGTDLNQLVLALADGQTGPTSGVQSAGHDMKTFFGIPATSLPINGGTYTTTLTRDGSSGANAHVKFAISGSTWVLSSSGSGGTVDPGTNFASGSLPVGASTVEFTTASSTGTIQTLGTTGSAIAVSSNPSLDNYITVAGTIGTGNGSIQVTIVFKNSGGSTISTTTYTASCIVQN